MSVLFIRQQLTLADPPSFADECGRCVGLARRTASHVCSARKDVATRATLHQRPRFVLPRSVRLAETCPLSNNGRSLGTR